MGKKGRKEENSDHSVLLQAFCVCVCVYIHVRSAPLTASSMRAIYTSPHSFVAIVHTYAIDLFSCTDVQDLYDAM